MRSGAYPHLPVGRIRSHGCAVVVSAEVCPLAAGRASSCFFVTDASAVTVAFDHSLQPQIAVITNPDIPQ